MNTYMNTYTLSYEMIINRPVEYVWPRMINYQDWNPEHIGAKEERLAGQKNQEDEIILEYKKTDDGYAPPIVLETVKIIPNEKIVWALYSPDSGASNGIWFVDFSLRKMGEKTMFIYHSYGWNKISDDINRADDRIAVQESAIVRMNINFTALKEYLEKK